MTARRKRHDSVTMAAMQGHIIRLDPDEYLTLPDRTSYTLSRLRRDRRADVVHFWIAIVAMAALAAAAMIGAMR